MSLPLNFLENHLLEVILIWYMDITMPINVAIILTGPVATNDINAHNSDNLFARLLSTIKQYVLNNSAIKPMMFNS